MGYLGRVSKEPNGDRSRSDRGRSRRAPKSCCRGSASHVTTSGQHRVNCLDVHDELLMISGWLYPVLQLSTTKSISHLPDGQKATDRFVLSVRKTQVSIPQDLFLGQH